MPGAKAPPRGLDGVVAAQTRLSHVDGLAAELIIGGYALAELTGRVSFEEAAHLLWHGALPAPVLETRIDSTSTWAFDRLQTRDG
ncbi:MAG: citrate/2-methylcitrate synthase [Candidatus Methylomirabilaceae bacterium]